MNWPKGTRGNPGWRLLFRFRVPCVLARGASVLSLDVYVSMFYAITTRATNFGKDPWMVRLLRAVLFFIPDANPDNEKLYPLVRKWYLELDDAGVPQREVGVGASGEPLFGAPDGRNFGFWTDTSEPCGLPERDLSRIALEEFEEVWGRIQKGKRESV